LSVLFSHCVQLLAPFGLFAPRPIASLAAGLLIVHQLLLIVSGNYAWLNWLTVLLGFSGLDDGTLARVFSTATPELETRPPAFELMLAGLALATLLLSVKPALNLISKAQVMNETYNPLHLVGSYGAFGSVSRQRYEVVLEGTSDAELSGDTRFREYEFKGKPGDPRRRPRQWAPYHLRLDWLMWFLPLRMPFKRPLRHELWLIRLLEKLLEGDRPLLSLLRHNPFPDAPPRYVRASLFRYQFTSREELAATGLAWKRTRIGEYVPPVSREAGSRRLDAAVGMADSGAKSHAQE
jgi:hypothetical protein